MCPRGDLNTETGAISPDRGNHAIKVTRVGLTRPNDRRRVRCSVRCLGLYRPVWLVPGLCSRAGSRAPWRPLFLAVTGLRRQRVEEIVGAKGARHRFTYRGHQRRVVVRCCAGQHKVGELARRKPGRPSGIGTLMANDANPPLHAQKENRPTALWREIIGVNVKALARGGADADGGADGAGLDGWHGAGDGDGDRWLGGS